MATAQQSPPLTLPVNGVFMLPLWFLNASFFLFVLFCALGAPGVARAAITIDICGHSLYECAENEKVGASAGRSTVECDPITSDCQVKQNDIMLNPKTPLDTPSGWTAPVPPSVEPTPPSTTSRETHGTPEYTGPAATAQQICDNIPPGVTHHTSTHLIYHNVNPAAEIIGAYGLSWAFVGTCNYGGATHAVRQAAMGCPAGYTFTGTCTLNNASAVIKPSDGKCTIKRDGNSFTGDPRDPDCSVNPGVSISGSTVTISPKPTGSENVRYSFTPDGGGTVSHSVPGTDGTTTQRTVQFGPPDSSTGDSLVTGTRESKFTGTGSLQNPNAQGDMPTDYNRETTQQSILAELKKERKIDETGTPDDASLKGASDSLDAEASARQSALEGIANVTDLGLGLSITWPVTSCEDPTFAMPGTSHSLTVPMCAARPNLQAGLNWLIAVLTAFHIFTIGASGVRS